MHGMYAVKEKQLYCNNIPRERKKIMFELSQICLKMVLMKIC